MEVAGDGDGGYQYPEDLDDGDDEEDESGVRQRVSRMMMVTIGGRWLVQVVKQVGQQQQLDGSGDGGSLERFPGKPG